MKTIHKYKLSRVYEEVIQMPEGAEILAIQYQQGSVCIWALVDVNKRMVGRNIITLGTGHSIPEGERKYKYISTVQVGEFVWHYFEVI